MKTILYLLLSWSAASLQADVLFAEKFSAGDMKVFSRYKKVIDGQPESVIKADGEQPGLQMTIPPGKGWRRAGIDIPINGAKLAPAEHFLEIDLSFAGPDVKPSFYLMGAGGTRSFYPRITADGRYVYRIDSFLNDGNGVPWDQVNNLRVSFFSTHHFDKASTIILRKVAIRTLGNEPDYSVLQKAPEGLVKLNRFGIFPEPREIREIGTAISVKSFCMNEGCFSRAAASFRADMAARNITEQQNGTWKIELISLPVPVKSQEGYELEIGAGGAKVRAGAEAGIFYGLKTLTQLFKTGKDGVSVPQVIIKDYPSCAMRAAILDLKLIDASNPDSISDLKKLLHAMSDLKLNTLFLEFGGNLKYASPLLAFPARADKAFSRDQAKELTAYAGKLNFKVIPYMQMISHCTWIMANPANRCLLENPDFNAKSFNMNWCPEHPEINSFITALIDENNEIFHPRAIHVGLDEVTSSEFGTCPRCRSKDKAMLLKNAILNIHALLEARKLKMIMWQDSLLGENTYYYKGIGAKIVNDLPRDIEIGVWHYRTDKDFVETQIRDFTDKGFKVMCTSFFDPENIRLIAQVSGKHLGMSAAWWYLVRTWSPLDGVANLPLAVCSWSAGYAWNPDRALIGENSFDAVNSTAEKLFTLPYGASYAHSQALPLPLNRRFGDNAGNWPGIVAPYSLPDFPGNIDQFKLPESGSNLCILSGHKDDLLPDAALIKVSGRAKRINFLHACNLPRNAGSLNYIVGISAMPLLGYYDIEYQNGKKISIPLQYRRNINDWNAAISAVLEKTIFQTVSAGRLRIRMGLYSWENPNPEDVIASITLRSVRYEATSIALAGISIDN